MKLLRYGNVGQERPGILDSNGKLRDLSSVVPDINGATLSEDALKKIAQGNLGFRERAPFVGKFTELGFAQSVQHRQHQFDAIWFPRPLQSQRYQNQNFYHPLKIHRKV